MQTAEAERQRFGIDGKHDGTRHIRLMLAHRLDPAPRASPVALQHADALMSVMTVLGSVPRQPFEQRVVGSQPELTLPRLDKPVRTSL